MARLLCTANRFREKPIPISPLLGYCEDRLAHNPLARMPNATNVFDSLDGNDGQGHSPKKKGNYKNPYLYFHRIQILT